MPALFFLILFFSYSSQAQLLGDEWLLDDSPVVEEVDQATVLDDEIQTSRSKNLHHSAGARYEMKKTKSLPRVPQAIVTAEEIKNTEIAIPIPQPPVASPKESDRKTKLERLKFQIKTGYGFEESESPLSYYSYSFSAPQVALAAEVNLTSDYSLAVAGTNTPVAELRNSSFSVLDDSIRKEIIAVSIKRNFNFEADSVAIEAGIINSTLRVPRASTVRQGYDRYDLSLGGRWDFSQSLNYKSIFEVGLRYGINYQEGKTKGDFKSGDDFSSLGINFGIGGDYKSSKYNGYVWGLSVTHQRGEFSGSANKVDLKTGQHVRSANLINTVGLLVFGYRWGK